MPIAMYYPALIEHFHGHLGCKYIEVCEHLWDLLSSHDEAFYVGFLYSNTAFFLLMIIKTVYVNVDIRSAGLVSVPGFVRT